MNMNHWRKMGWKKITDNKELSVKNKGIDYRCEN